jgi:hypothetical protein
MTAGANWSWQPQKNGLTLQGKDRKRPLPKKKPAKRKNVATVDTLSFCEPDNQDQP